jgi:hypothetical protein
MVLIQFLAQSHLLAVVMAVLELQILVKMVVAVEAEQDKI